MQDFVKVLQEVRRANSPVNPWEVFDGRDWPQFKKGMEAQARLLSMDPLEELQWLVSRLTPRIKAIWAGLEDHKYYPCQLKNTVAAFDVIFGERKRFSLFDFAKLRQRPMEPIAEYLARIEEGAKNCEAKEHEKLEVGHKGLQNRLKEQLSWRDRSGLEVFAESVSQIERMLINQEGWRVKSKYESNEPAMKLEDEYQQLDDSKKKVFVDFERKPVRTGSIVCHRCNGIGHYARNCSGSRC